jgi:hypothetical protein
MKYQKNLSIIRPIPDAQRMRPGQGGGGTPDFKLERPEFLENPKNK